MKSSLPAALAAIVCSSSLGAEPLKLQLCDRVESGADSGVFTMRLREQQWDPAQTAVIVCDMWDAHHCRNAVLRVDEMSPRMNALLKEMRGRGALIVHSPSACMEFYKDHPARKRARAAPAAENLPPGIGDWLHWIDEREQKAGYPIDHSDGGEDDDPAEHAKWAETLTERGRNPRSPWVRQTAALEIDPERDAITDSGVENWNLLQQRGIKNVLMVGVHTNMCVLGRPFGLRQLAKNGVNVALVRDLTDTMYNPAMPPKVSHYAGTDLIVEHIEKYVCPTVGSEQILGGAPASFSGDARPKIVFLIGEREYQTAQTLPRFAAEHLTADYRIQYLMAGDGENDFGDVAAALGDADLLFVSVRRRTPPAAQMAAIEKFIKAGKPVVGIRTSSHAFALREGAPPAGHRSWGRFDPEVFGGNYHGHHGNQLKSFAKAVAAGHPILAGVGGDEFPTGGSLYEVLPLVDGTTVLLEGRAEGVGQKQPVAWTFTNKFGGRSFYTSLGHVDDFERTEFVRTLKNAIGWALDGPVGDGDKVGAADARAPDKPEERPDAGGGLSPRESLARMRVPDDLAVDLVLSEPLVAQPLHLSFDARGRLWVVQYRQYPDPAGLVELSRDKVWRVAYDKVPPPPPHAEGSPFRGKDRISIHEDTDGDGTFDVHKVFLEGLNMATSVAHDEGGIWVTNPPYLLFFPDRDGDDLPDGKPEVHLQGFGLEDSHSIANSLTWGPDGWLYGAQGSTVSGAIFRPGIDRPEDAVKSMGQNIWRYHPKTRKYEIYAEGGGNAFGVEIDSQARVYSGHNGGDTRGFHYVQGGYYQKTWGKHGALTNPHSYGFFPAMKNVQVARFTHQFIIYEDVVLPERYRGKLWGVDVLHNNIVLTELLPLGSTFETRDIERVVQSDDPWFRPVMVAEGPDGAVYVADWYDEQVNHYKNHEGQIDVVKGRVYRVRNKVPPAGGAKSNWKLERERWGGELGRAADIRGRVDRSTDDGVALRAWLIELAQTESDLEALAQLACSAKRVDAQTGLGVAAALAQRDALADDPYIPLLVWWAIEGHAGAAPERVVALFEDSTLWRHRLVRQTLLSRVMRRFAAEDTAAGYRRCAQLLRLAPDDASKRLLMDGYGEAVAGRPPAGLPAELLAEFRRIGAQLPLALRLRIGDEGALADALAKLADGAAAEGERSELATALGEVAPEPARDTLVGVLRAGAPAAVEVACIATLAGSLDVPEVFGAVLAKAGSSSENARAAALDLLAGNAAAAKLMLARAAAGELALDAGDLVLAEKLRAHHDPEIDRHLAKIWNEKPAPAGAYASDVARVKAVLAGGGGVPKRGEPIFGARCGTCHQMFGKGGRIGPDLTSYQRGDQDTLLLSILAPSAEVREGFENTVVKMKSGAVFAGFRVDEDAGFVTLRELSGSGRTLPKADIASLEVSRVSMMPPGLLAGLDDAALRDLFAYLRSTTPPF